jgi:hypothetical protein
MVGKTRETPKTCATASSLGATYPRHTSKFGAIGGRIGLLLEASALSVTSDERER